MSLPRILAKLISELCARNVSRLPLTQDERDGNREAEKDPGRRFRNGSDVIDAKLRRDRIAIEVGSADLIDDAQLRRAREERIERLGRSDRYHAAGRNREQRMMPCRIRRQ